MKRRLFAIITLLALLSSSLLLSTPSYADSISIVVSATNANGTPTGITVAVGQTLTIQASGFWCSGGIKQDGSPSCGGPEGIRPADPGETVDLVLPNQLIGLLIGRIGTWVFPIGSSAQISAQASGQLFLLMNDRTCCYADNSGQVTATVDGGTVSIGKFLNVPLLKQGISPYNNNDPLWEGLEYDHATKQPSIVTCGTTIAACGCALTSVAMVLRYYGVVNPVNGTSTDPNTVNEYFKRNTVCGQGGCASLGYSYGSVRWTAAGDYSNEANARYGTQKIVWNGDGGFDSTTVRQDIDNDRPVILGVPGHWVVATGYTNNTFTINDPLFNRTQLDDPAYRNTATQGIRRYVKTNSDFSTIEVAILAPAQVLITDPNGKRAGFDSATSTIVSEIPNSTYLFDQALADDTGVNPPPPDGAGVHWVIVSTPEAGAYQIEVSAPPNQLYSFAAYGSDRDAHVVFSLFEGQPAPGQQPRYTFNYDRTPGVTNLALQVPIDIKPGETPNPINLNSKYVIPVAILSTPTFDATTVDFRSVKFGPKGALKVDKKPVIEDVNSDGKPDLILHFAVNQTGIVAGATQACLTGKTTNGFEIQGCDAVRIVS